MQINVKMPIIVGILTLMSKINFVLSGVALPCGATGLSAVCDCGIS